MNCPYIFVVVRSHVHHLLQELVVVDHRGHQSRVSRGYVRQHPKGVLPDGLHGTVEQMMQRLDSTGLYNSLG